MKHSSFACPRTFVPVSLCLAALLQSAATAATHTWTGPNSGGVWSASGNWTNGVPTSDESGGTVVSFGSNVSSTFNIPGLKVNQILFNGGGNTINGTAGMTLSVSGTAQIENIWSKTGDNTLADTLSLGYVDTSTVFIRVDANTLTMASPTSGTTGVLKRGAATLTIAAQANANTGPTSVGEGTLVLDSDGTNSAILGDITVGTGNGPGATLTLAQSLEIKDTSNVLVNVDGTFNTGASSETVATLNVTGGDVNLSTGNLTVNGAFTMTGGTITGTTTTGNLILLGDATATSSATEPATISSKVTLAGTRTFTVNDGTQATDLNLSNVIAGVGANLIKAGPGNLLMSTAIPSTYSGTTTVSQGLLTLNGGSSAVIPGTLVIGTGGGAAGSAIVRLGQGSEIANTAAVNVKSDGLFDLNGFGDAIGALDVDQGSVTIGAAGSLTPSTINMNGGSITGTGTASLTLNGDVTATSTASSTATITTNITLLATRNITVNPGGNAPHFVINGVVSETSAGFGLTKLGTGTMNLTGPQSNTYTGTTAVTTGVLQLRQNAGRTIQGPLVIGNGVDPAGTATVRELIQNDLLNTISVTINKSGVLDMNGFSDTVDSLTGDGTLAVPTVSAVPVNLVSNFTAGSAGATSTFAGTISGTGNFRKSGTGTLTLSGKLAAALNTMVVNDGTLALNLGAGTAYPVVLQVGDSVGALSSAIARLDGPNQLAPAGSVDIKSDGVLNLNGKAATTGTLTMTTGNVSFAGGSLTVATGMTMNGGTVTGGTGLLTLNGSLTATSTAAGGASISSPLALNGNRPFSVTAGPLQPELVINGVISDGPSGPGGFFKNGNGTMRLSTTTNNYSGTTTVDRGILELGNSISVAILGPLVIGNDVDAAGSAIVKILTSFNIGGASDVTIKSSGKYDLNGFPDRAGSLSGTGPVTLGTGTLNLLNGSNATYDGLISGSGGVIKNGTGTQIFTQNHTYAGNTAITSGKLIINGTQTSTFSVGATGILGGIGNIGPTLNANTAGAKVSPGGGSGTSPGILHVNGAGNLNNGKLIVRLNDATALKSDQLIVSGNLNITGASVLPIPLGPVAATPHVIATYGGTLTGTFASVPAGCTINYAYNDGISTSNIAITVNNPWQAWLAGYELNPATTGLPDADPDKDGIPNAIEFVLGLDPTALSSGLDLPGGTVSGSDYLFSFRRAGAAAAYNPVIQTSTTLSGPGAWTNVVSGITVDANFYGPGIDRVTATISRTGKTKLFARLVLTGL